MDAYGCGCVVSVAAVAFLGVFTAMDGGGAGRRLGAVRFGDALGAAPRSLPLRQAILRAGTALGVDGFVRRAEQRRMAAQRRNDILRELPNFLDIVTLGLSAGLSFDASIDLYCSRYCNGLAKELADALVLWRIGACSRQEALVRMSERMGVAALERFSASVSEALSFGTPLASVLQRQAEVIREGQRFELQEQMEKAPVKMLVPLGTLIVPAMLLAILGPLLAPALGGGGAA